MERYNDVTLLRIYNVIDCISNVLTMVGEKDKVVCYAGGFYGTEKKLRKLLSEYDIDIIKIKSGRYGIYRFIPVSAPLYYLIEINNTKELTKIVKALESPIATMLYIFNKKYKKEFCDEFDFISNNSFYMKKIANKDHEYLLYGIDTDNIESSTDMMEYVSYGSKLSNKMKCFL